LDQPFAKHDQDVEEHTKTNYWPSNTDKEFIFAYFEIAAWSLQSVHKRVYSDTYDAAEHV